ncbi:MAG: hypothetical protein WAQ53_06705 [Thiofilum sp.]|uniref:COG1470 family protein n=1 Tax=Thiofilum sp. TaxID=2212733 RepID=UPI0025CCA21D|nr:hypothetical protein [Thiofilum sp.]MBK8455026.1 hypothetical protein [Thiofilum sp.]
MILLNLRIPLKIFCLIIFVAFNASLVHAEVLVTKLLHDFDTSTNQSHLGSFDIENLGKRPVVLNIIQQDKVDDHALGRVWSNRAWIKLPINQLRLEPRAKKNITFKIQSPNNVKTGTYWSSIYVDPVLPVLLPSKIQSEPGKIKFLIQQKLRYEIQIRTHIGKGEPKLNFSAPKLEKNQSNQKVFGINIKNSGNFHAQTKVSLEVFRANGQRVGLLQGNTRGLYPGAQKRFEVNVAKLPVGQYKALLLATDTKTGRNFGVDVNLNIQP